MAGESYGRVLHSHVIPEIRASVNLESIATDDYVREVLPDTFPLWGNARDFERYVADFRSIATSAYGKRRQYTVGLRDGDEIACSCKNYDREVRWSGTALRATGIGAVFTPAGLRGRGYATAMLGALMDSERAAGRDLAFLYSDIHPAFYQRLGFVKLPSRVMTMRSESLDGTAIGAVPIEAKNWPAVRRCFETLDRARPWSFRRTPLVWDWMRQRLNAPAREGSQAVHLGVHRGRDIVAYAFGRRIFRGDTFALDDFGFTPEGAALVPALLRAAAGDLRRVGGWLPPPVARDVLPRGSVRTRKDAVFMIAPLSPLARAWWAENEAATLRGKADATWNSDHV